ncbi:MAG: 30S ribosomal protein S4 [Leptospiraceae bacterium]|nr:30S ribosomal protein S4 [Leptospiraceae bacterium]MDW8306057.1 30S ribosomal protein S4 [Leptospiraceae bacterium]
MGRYIGPVCRLCRREGLKLFLKGRKCSTEKCVFNHRKNPPGPPPRRKPKNSGYTVQLREKQKVKRIYGVLERQFRNYFEKAQRMKGITGENLLVLLERRLDNAVYRAGFASSRAQARNFVSHGHIRVNGKRVDISSYLVEVGDVISVHESLKDNEILKANVEFARGMGLIPDWLDLAEDGTSAKVLKLPTREHVDIPIKEQVIIELYSK